MFDPALDEDRGNRPYWTRLLVVAVVTLGVSTTALFALVHLSS
jgi:hypothetical protein